MARRQRQMCIRDRIQEVVEKLESLKAAEAVFEARVKSGLLEPDYMEELMSSSKTLYVS